MGVGNWVGDNIGRNVSDESSTLSWVDLQIDGEALFVRFKRLYELYDNKMATIREMKTIDGGEVKETWAWKKETNLLVWEEDQSVVNG